VKRIKEKIKDIYFLIRYAINSMLLKFLYILGVRPSVLANLFNDEVQYLYYDSRKVKLSRIRYRYKDFKLDEGNCRDHSVEEWEAFILNIKTNGVLNNPVVYLTQNHVSENENLVYIVQDGNHRLKALEVLYGKDYEATLECYSSLTTIKYKREYKRLKNKLIIDRYKERISVIEDKTYFNQNIYK
tara:strand:+ start:76 stop:633 length:558 start_codon:yes stop_codon:yes gene_type:complete